MSASIPIEDIVPGGILATDHVHRETDDGICSRCGEIIADGDAPLMLWLPPDRTDMLVYCTRCLDPDTLGAPR